MAREAIRLAGVQTFRGDELVETRSDAVGDLCQQIGSLGHRHSAPRAAQRGFGGTTGGVDFDAATFRHIADDGVVGRRAIDPSLARRALCEHAVDEMGGVAARPFKPAGRFLQRLNAHAAFSVRKEESAAAPALAQSRSSSSEPPETPMAPTTTPLSTSGRPPPNNTTPGRSAMP